LLTLVKAQVWKYKSIEDSTPVDLASDVTALVGKNESGKTAFLEALHKALPFEKVEFNYVADYPRKDLIRYRPQHEAKNYQKTVALTFHIEESLAEKINSEVFNGYQVIQAGSTFTRSTTIANSVIVDFSLNLKSALEALKSPLSELENVDEVSRTPPY